MDEMLNQMFGNGKYLMYVEVLRPRRPKEDPVVQVEVELLFRPYLPALAVAHPTGHSILTHPSGAQVHYSYWIDLFRRPLLPDHEGPHYPPDVAAALSELIATYDATRSGKETT